MEGLGYKEGLDRLGLLSLECRRLRGNLIEVYKIMRGIDKVIGSCRFPRMGDFQTRGHILSRVQNEHIRSKCSQLEEIQIQVEELESKMKTLCHNREGERSLEIFLQRMLTPLGLGNWRLVMDQGQEAVTA
eukprot:g28199.t1